MTVAGVVGGWIGQPPATVDEWLKAVVIAQQLHNGAHRGLQELVLNTGKSLWLNFVTAGGYGVYSNGRAMYEGYKEDGALGALNAINPLYHLARGVEDTVDALERGDYEAVGAIGAPTAVLGAALGVGVGRALGAGGAAAQGAARGPAASLDLAQQVARVGGGGRWRTVSLLETAEGPTLVGGGATDLSLAQKALAERLGLTVAEDMPGFHAEQTVVHAAGKMGLTPTSGVATNLVCETTCTPMIQSLGGWVNGRHFGF